MGQRPLTYVATDQTDPARTAQVSLLTTAVDVRVTPRNGPPQPAAQDQGPRASGAAAPCGHT